MCGHPAHIFLLSPLFPLGIRFAFRHSVTTTGAAINSKSKQEGTTPKEELSLAGHETVKLTLSQALLCCMFAAHEKGGDTTNALLRNFMYNSSGAQPGMRPNGAEAPWTLQVLHCEPLSKKGGRHKHWSKKRWHVNQENNTAKCCGHVCTSAHSDCQECHL